MLGALSPQQTLFFVILIVAFGLLITEKLRNDAVAVLIIIALTASGLLSSTEALAGFGSEPAIAVAAIFVLGQALHQTGLSQLAGQWIARASGSSYTRIVAVIMLAVAPMSAFTHHVTTTAVMLPVSMTIARDREISPSRLLMPMSFAASLGTTITIIGAPAFLIASTVLQKAGHPGLSVFSIAPVGLVITLVGTLFMLTVGRRLLPDRGAGEQSANRFRLTDYFTELTVLADSPFVDKQISEIEAGEGHRELFVTGWLRHGRPVPAPYGDRLVRPGDVLMVRTSPEQMVTITERAGVELHPITQYGTAADHGANAGDENGIGEKLVQAIVAPGSELAGRTLGNLNFHDRYGAIVVGLWRRSGWLNEELSRIRLEPGDVLVLEGDEESLSRVANDRAFLMLMPFQGESRPRRKAPLAALIMVLTVLVAAFGVLPLPVAMIAGACAMVLTGCLRPRQAYRAIDARIYVFIAGAIPLGDAMEKSGASKLLASWIQSTVGGLNETVVLLVIFGIVAVLTQFMSDSATVALFGPVATALAAGLGRNPEAFVVTVAMAAVVAFITPIGHHGNLLIYGPGRYQFADFVRVGTPLTILIGIVVVLTTQLVWPG
ncbi:MAG TPA: SLC13 family permease [Chloroflexota bacterium]